MHLAVRKHGKACVVVPVLCFSGLVFFFSSFLCVDQATARRYSVITAVFAGQTSGSIYYCGGSWFTLRR